MESLCSFDPVWSRDEAVVVPRNAVKAMRERIVVLLLEGGSVNSFEAPNINQIIQTIFFATDALFQTSFDDDNIMLKHLRQASSSYTDPSRLIKDAILIWYQSAVPAITRDPSSGLAPEGDERTTADGITRDVWERDRAAEQFLRGNMGLMGMLMTSEAWITPTETKMFTVSLCANVTTSLIYSAYMIVMASPQQLRSAHQVPASQSQITEAFRLYIRCSWLLAREGQYSPGAEFGANTSEIKISSNGKRLLSKIGRAAWAEAPLWHPVRKGPGSPWNKFIRNSSQATFSTPSPSLAPEFGHTPSRFQIPSSALSLIEPWEQYYSQARARFDQTNRPRKILSPEDARKQFANLSRQTGNTYRERRLRENNASQSDDISQAYAYHLPMVKKPIADMRGDLTLPFLTSAARALRFEEDPAELEPDLFLMSFDI